MHVLQNYTVFHNPGSTDTSLWTHYAAGERDYCGNAFPDGMRKNDRLETNIITPTTKSASHDVPISAADIVRQGLMTLAEWDEVWPANLQGVFNCIKQDCVSTAVMLMTPEEWLRCV